MHQALVFFHLAQGGRYAGQIMMSVKIKLALGWLAIAAVMLWR